MRSTLADAMETGLVVSFQTDGQRHQEVLLDWDGRYVPHPGDVISCVQEDAEGEVARRVSGTVVGPRKVEFRRSAEGRVSLWLRVQTEKCSIEAPAQQTTASLPRRITASPVVENNGKHTPAASRKGKR